MWRYFLSGLLLLLAIPRLATQANSSSIEAYPCHFESHVATEVQCGVLTTPENYDEPDGKQVYLPYIIFKSTSPNPHPDPVVLLVGGPGGSGTAYPQYTFNPYYEQFLHERDFILYDQRGTGRASPLLDCPNLLSLGYRQLGNPMTEAERRASSVEALLTCQRNLINRGNDLAQYNTRTSAADLEALRIGLGYEQWNLLGVSYGSKLALTAMRDYPQGIRSVILDSTVPLQSHLWYDIAMTQRRAFDLLFADCAADPTCNIAYPDLANRFYGLIDQLNAEPALVEMGGYTFYVNGDLVADGIFQNLYRVARIVELPRLITQMAEGDLTALRPMIENYLSGPIGISEGMYYAVQCQEEVFFTPLAETLAQAEQLPLALQASYQASVEDIYAVCEGLAIPQVDARENEAVSSDIPTLILSGEYDPITPPPNGLRVAATLPNSYVYELRGIGHGVVRSSACGLTIAMNFLENPAQTPAAGCLENLTAPDFR